MKKYCKHVDITDRELISKAVYECLNGKLKRKDTLELLAKHSNMKADKLKEMIIAQGKKSAYPYIENLIDTIREELIEENIKFIPIQYSVKIDPSSGKERKIGIQNIKQQIYDYVAIEGLRPILKRIGEYQCASIPGRGQIYGVKHIRRWLRNKDICYAGKADISKCYESITHENMMGFLRRYIKNDKLLWLINELIRTFDKGLSIGSYLSQYLCNLYMSQLYHYIMENLFHERKKKDGSIEKVRLVYHAMFYVDDILILGKSEKHIKSAMRKIIKYCEKMGLAIKANWITFKTKLTDRKDDKGQFIDMMGFRIYRWHTTIRRRVFKRIRKYYCRALTRIRKHKALSLNLVRKLISYYGFIKNTDSFKIIQKYKVKLVLKIAKRRLQNESKIFRATTAC